MGFKRNSPSFRTILYKLCEHHSSHGSHLAGSWIPPKRWSASISRVMDSTAATILRFKSGRSTGSSGRYTRSFTYPHRNKSHGVRLGDHGGHRHVLSIVGNNIGQPISHIVRKIRMSSSTVVLTEVRTHLVERKDNSAAYPGMQCLTNALICRRIHSKSPSQSSRSRVRSRLGSMDFFRA